MAAPLMPKAIAVWLVDNTMLTFEQVAAFCHLHDLEVQAIADDEVAIGMHGLDPVAGGELTKEEIERCEADAISRRAGFLKSNPPARGLAIPPYPSARIGRTPFPGCCETIPN